MVRLSTCLVYLPAQPCIQFRSMITYLSFCRLPGQSALLLLTGQARTLVKQGIFCMKQTRCQILGTANCPNPCNFMCRRRRLFLSNVNGSTLVVLLNSAVSLLKVPNPFAIHLISPTSSRLCSASSVCNLIPRLREFYLVVSLLAVEIRRYMKTCEDLYRLILIQFMTRMCLFKVYKVHFCL